MGIDDIGSYPGDESASILSDVRPSSDGASDNIAISRGEALRQMESEALYVASGQGREGNLESALGGFLEAHPELEGSIRGKRVLLKVNAVDPENPSVCTSAESLDLILRTLSDLGASGISVTDLPAKQCMADSQGSEVESGGLFAMFREKLGYSIENYPVAEFIDLRSLPQKALQTDGGPVTMYDLSGWDTVVVLSLPKEHGQLEFSGNRKNCVGLVPQDERNRILHSGNIKDWKKENEPGLNAISEAMIQQGREVIYILDGYETVRGHEHNGPSVVTDYAVVSKDPYNADLVAAAKSLSESSAEQIGYLHRMPIKEDPKKIKGEIGELATGEAREHRFFIYFTSEGRGLVSETMANPTVDKIKVKPIEDMLTTVSSESDIAEVDNVIAELGKAASDRALMCLLQIANLTQSPAMLQKIYYYIHFPLVSSRGLDSNFSDKIPSPEELQKDEIYLGYVALAERMKKLGLVR